MDNGNGTALMQRADDTARSVSAFDGNGEAFTVVIKIARGLAASTIVPEAYQGNEANCMVALEYAHRLGASVLAVMQNLDIIHGRPSLRSTFLIGTVNATRRFTPLRWRFQGTEGSDDWGCRCVATDRESGEECEGPLITIKLAKVEGWYDRKGTKWKTTPELMLMYRSAGWWTRLFAPELSLGLHTADEVEDYAMPQPQVRTRTVAQLLDAGDNPPLVGKAIEPGTPTEDAARLTMARQAFEVAAAKRPDLLQGAARAELVKDVTGKDEPACTVSDYAKLTQCVESLPGREPGSDDE
jgi:hypothetical protein